MIGRTGMNERLGDRLVGIRKLGILAHQSDIDLSLRVLDLIDELDPCLQVGLPVVGQLQLVESHDIEFLVQHHQRDLVDRRHVDRFDYRVHVHVAEQRYLTADLVGQMLFGAQHQNVGLQPVLEQLLDRVLRRFRLQLARGCHVGDQRQMHHQRVAVPQLVAQLADRLDIRQGLDVADRAADFRNDDVVDFLRAEQLDAALDFIRNVRNDLHGLAQKLAPSLLVDYALIDAARGHVVGLRSRNVRKPLVMSQIEVGLGAVLGYVAFAVLVRIQRAGIDVDIRIEFLDGHLIAASLQQLGQRGGDDALAQRGSHASGYKNEFRLVRVSYSHDVTLLACLSD